MQRPFYGRYSVIATQLGFQDFAAVCWHTCRRALLGSRCKRTKRARDTPQTPSPTWRALLAVSPLAGPEVDRLPLQRLGLEGLLEHVAHHVGTDVGIPQVSETCSPVERACRWLAHAGCSEGGALPRSDLRAVSREKGEDQAAAWPAGLGWWWRSGTYCRCCFSFCSPHNITQSRLAGVRLLWSDPAKQRKGSLARSPTKFTSNQASERLQAFLHPLCLRRSPAHALRVCDSPNASEDTHSTSNAMSGLIYSFVARDGTVLAEYSALAGNFRAVAVECLQNSQITDDKFTVTADAYTFNYLVHAGYSECGFPSAAAHHQWDPQSLIVPHSPCLGNRSRLLRHGPCMQPSWWLLMRPTDGRSPLPSWNGCGMRSWRSLPIAPAQHQRTA